MKKKDNIEPATKADLVKLEGKIDEKAREYRDEILTKLDDVMGKFETFREDAEIGAYQTREIREEVDDHEKRIKRLEKAQA